MGIVLHKTGMASLRKTTQRLLARMHAEGSRCTRKNASLFQSQIGDVLGDRDVASITESDCGALFAAQERDGKAPRTRLNTRNLLSRLYRECVREGLVERSPVPSLPGHNVDADPWWRDLERYDPGELSAIAYAPSSAPLHRAIWKFAIATIARVSEIGGASWSALDLSRKPYPGLRIETAYNTAEGEIRETKTRAPRMIPLNQDGQEAVQRCADLWPLLVGRPFTNADPIIPVVRYRGGGKTPRRAPRKVRRLRNDTAWHWLEDDLAMAGLRRRGVHAFRATGISVLLEERVPESMVLALTHPRTSGGDAVLRGYLRPRWAVLCDLMDLLRVVKPSEVAQLRLPFT